MGSCAAHEVHILRYIEALLCFDSVLVLISIGGVLQCSLSCIDRQLPSLISLFIFVWSISEANPKNNWMRGEQACLVHRDEIVTDVTIYWESNLSLRNGFSSQNICRQNCFRYYSLHFTFYWVLIVFAHTRINWPWLTPNLFGGILDWFPPGSWYPLDLAELIDTSTLFLPPYHCPWLIIYLFHLSRKIG